MNKIKFGAYIKEARINKKHMSQQESPEKEHI